MPVSDYIPFNKPPVTHAFLEARPSVDLEKASNIARLLKVSSFALGFTGLSSLASRSRSSFEVAPYDLERISKAADTDSFVKQGLSKYKELLWKEGWSIAGENDDAITYIKERIDFMEIAMGRSFQSFLVEVGDQLVRYHNCFIAKSRGDLGPFFPGKLTTPEGKDPIVGYYIIPAETVEIQRNNNRVVAYRQKLDMISEMGFSSGRRSRAPRWPADEVIHLTIDRKPGRAWGTPFLVTTLDDVIALRQMEEDIQNLVHKELAPLYKYQVGTPEFPAEDEEIIQAWQELQNLREDGGLILPERHDVDVIGAEGNSLDASSYLAHFVTRVVVGLGMSPHHLGIMNEAGNRAIADRLDIALYDKVKSYQKYLEDMIRIGVLNELLFEGGFDPITDPVNENTPSSKCFFKFNEIDVDTQVKKENHTIQKWVSNIIDLDEVREELGYDHDVNEEDLSAAVTARIAAHYAPLPQTGGSTTSKPDAQQPSNGGRPNLKNDRKGVGNKSRPSNQHGRRSSPNIRHAVDGTWLNDVVEALGQEDESSEEFYNG